MNNKRKINSDWTKIIWR